MKSETKNAKNKTKMQIICKKNMHKNMHKNKTKKRQIYSKIRQICAVNATTEICRNMHENMQNTSNMWKSKK
jgi:hypothetical protein